MQNNDKENVPSSRLEKLPEHILDDIIAYVTYSSPSSHLVLLTKLGSAVFRATCHSLFNVLVADDDMRRFTEHHQSQTGTTPLSTVLLNPARYGEYVRQLRIVDPACFGSPKPESSLFDTNHSLEQEESSGNDESCPMSAQALLDLLKSVPSLEIFSWRASVPPPDGVCEMLSTYNQRLTSFQYMPVERLLPVSRAILSSLPRWNAPSLPLLSSLNLKSLRISRLSQSGVQSFVRLLSMLELDSRLEEVCVDTNWLDEPLCQQIGSACSKVKRMEIGSDGSRFSDKCLVTLLPLCEHLEAFTLREVQGRLSKTLWENLLDYPPRLRRFHININENSIQHSWSIEHLSSLQYVPINSLTHITIRRMSSPFQHQVNDIALLKSIPGPFVRSLENAKNLQYLECDWWSWTCDDLRVPLESCPDLRALRIAFEEPFTKLLSMVLPFSTATKLGSLAVTLLLRHLMTLPPSPTFSSRRSVSRSPSLSPVRLTKSLSSSVDTPSLVTEEGNSPLYSSNSNPGSSNSVPLRDIRKFAKRCQSLYEIIIYGKHGEQIHWQITRHSSNSNLEVSLSPPIGLPEDAWQSVRREEAALQANWSPLYAQREGSIWAGPKADKYVALDAKMRKQETPTKAANGPKLSLKSFSASPTKLSIQNMAKSVQGDANRPPRQMPSPISPDDTKPLVGVTRPPSPLTRRQVSTASDLITLPEGSQTSFPVRARAQSYNGNKRTPSTSTNSTAQNRRRGKGSEKEMHCTTKSEKSIQVPGSQSSQ